MNFTSSISQALFRSSLPQLDVDNYCLRVQYDYEELVPFLPEYIQSFLSIGEGWGGHALYLAKHYGGSDTEVNLIEGTEEVQKTRTGFHETATPYRNGNVAVQLLETMDVAVRLYPVNAETPNLTIPVDLITSFCSWGHHYAIGTYLQLAQRSLSAGGHLLIDIRTKTDGIRELVRGGFVPVKSVKSKPKFDRMLFVKSRG